MIRRAAVLLLAAGGLSLGGAAWAHWGAQANTGSGSAVAASVNAAATPVANVSAAQAVTVTWSAATLSNGVAVDGYVVKRYHATTLAVQTIGAGCTGTITALTCTETGVPVGSWRYSVYPRSATNWVGTESGLTTAVSITAPTITLVRTIYNGAASTTGTLSGFGVNESVTYRLDAATALTGFPAVVDTTGGAPITSLSIPATSEGTHTVYAIGGAGSVASTTITVDNTAPTISSSQSPVANGAGWNTVSPVQVTLSASDALTGVASVKYTTDGTDPTSSGTAVTYTGPFNVASTHTVRYYAADVAGNASPIGSRAVQIDTVAPANSLALSSVTGATLSGSTIFYKGSSVGSFTITNSLTDAASGPASSTTSSVTGFTHTPSTVSTPSGGPYVSSAISWGAGTSGSPTVTVTGADVAGNTTATVLTLTTDLTPPSGGSVDATGLVGTGSRYSTSTTLSVAFSKGTDAGVGLAASGALLQRATATLSGGACGAYGSFGTVATDPTSPRADTVADQACYKYQYVVADGVGNSTTYTSGDVKVDTTAPSAPSLAYSALTNAYASGGTLWYRAAATSGGFTVTASSTDAASAVSGYTFPTLGTNWSSAAGGTSVTAYSWSGAPAAPGSNSITATNNAALTANTTIAPVNDSTAPSGGSITYSAQVLPSPSLAITFATGTDGGSGISTSLGLLQRSSAPMTAGVCGAYAAFATIATGPASPYTDTTMVDNTCNLYRYVVSDNVGNTANYTSVNVVKAPHFYNCAAAATAYNPYLYWKLGETAGAATAADSSGNGRTGVYNGGGFTYGVVGACGNGATFNGSTSNIYPTSATAVAAPAVFSLEMWFKTTNAQGKLIGFGNFQSGLSIAVDRHVFINALGKLVFGTNDSVLSGPTVATTASVNDGNWHHAVATYSVATGMNLYVDTQLVGTRAVNLPSSYNGYWRVGADNLLGWTLASANYSGTLSNLAVYSGTVLTAADVYDHYVAGALTSGGLVALPSISASAQSAGAAAAPRRTATKPPAPVSPPPSSAPPAAPPSDLPFRTPVIPSFTPPAVRPSDVVPSGPDAQDDP